MADPVTTPDGSPVNEGDLIIPDSGTDLCGAVLGMIQSIAVLRSDLDYRVDETDGKNLPTREFANQIGAMVFPPGTVMPFKITAVGTSADNALLKIEVEKLWKKADGSEALDQPWWVLCDGDDATGAPDLIDRFIIGAGTRGTGADTILRPVGEEGGSNELMFDVENLPNHSHKLVFGSTNNPLVGNSAMAFEHIPISPPVGTLTGWAESRDEGVGGDRTVEVANYTVKTGPVHDSEAPPEETAAQAGAGKPADNRPAFVALVYAMRTSRMS